MHIDFVFWLLLQTVGGNIPYWNLLLLWPYHVGLRSKLWIQRRVSTEPHWTLITDGWYDSNMPCTARSNTSVHRLIMFMMAPKIACSISCNAHSVQPQLLRIASLQLLCKSCCLAAQCCGSTCLHISWTAVTSKVHDSWACLNYFATHAKTMHVLAAGPPSQSHIAPHASYAQLL